MEEGESILWVGQPEEGTLSSHYLSTRIALPVFAIPINALLILWPLLLVFWLSIFFLFLVAVGVFIDIIFIKFFLWLRKNRRYDLSTYLITSRNLYFTSPKITPNIQVNHTLNVDLYHLDDYYLDSQVFKAAGRIVYTAIENIEKCAIEAITGIRKEFGYKGFNITITYKTSTHFPEICFSQIPHDKIPELINVLTEKLSFHRVFEEITAETYVRKEDNLSR